MNQIKVKPVDTGFEITLSIAATHKLLAVLLEPKVPLYSAPELNDFRRKLASLLQSTNRNLIA